MTLNKSLFVCLDLHVASGTCGCSERAAGADQSRTVLPHHQNRLIVGFQHICPTFMRQIMKTPFFLESEAPTEVKVLKRGLTGTCHVFI